MTQATYVLTNVWIQSHIFRYTTHTSFDFFVHSFSGPPFSVQPLLRYSNCLRNFLQKSENVHLSKCQIRFRPMLDEFSHYLCINRYVSTPNIKPNITRCNCSSKKSQDDWKKFCTISLVIHSYNRTQLCWKILQNIKISASRTRL